MLYHTYIYIYICVYNTTSKGLSRSFRPLGYKVMKIVPNIMSQLLYIGDDEDQLDDLTMPNVALGIVNDEFCPEAEPESVATKLSKLQLTDTPMPSYSMFRSFAGFAFPESSTKKRKNAEIPESMAEPRKFVKIDPKQTFFEVLSE